MKINTREPSSFIQDNQRFRISEPIQVNQQFRPSETQQNNQQFKPIQPIQSRVIINLQRPEPIVQHNSSLPIQQTQSILNIPQNNYQQVNRFYNKNQEPQTQSNFKNSNNSSPYKNNQYNSGKRAPTRELSLGNKKQEQISNKNSKYNLYSMLDQPFELIKTKGCSALTFPSVQCFATDYYDSKPWRL